MKKIWMAGVACFAACCICAPGLASYIQAQEDAKQDTAAYQEEEEDMGLAGRIAAIGIGSKDMAAAVSALEDKEEPEAAQDRCAYYVDENGDGICDHCAGGTGSQSQCAYYVDGNGDGICDHCAGSTGSQERCAYYVDGNGDGICDHCAGGQQDSSGHHGGGHHREQHHH